jgi:hypothetical protein
MPRYQSGERLAEGVLRVIEAGGDHEECKWVELELVTPESCGARTHILEKDG